MQSSDAVSSNFQGEAYGEQIREFGKQNNILWDSSEIPVTYDQNLIIRIVFIINCWKYKVVA